MFQRTRTRELVRGNEGPTKRGAKSRESKFPSDEKAHLSQDVLEAAQLASDNESNFIKFSLGAQIAKLELKACRFGRTTGKWKDSLTQERGKVQGTLLAHVLDELKMRGQVWATQFRAGSSIVGSMEEPGAHPPHTCPPPELTPEQLLGNSKWRIKAGRAAVTDPNVRASWGEALDQAAKGRFGGPSQFDKGGRLMTGKGPLVANPAFRFGARQDKKSRAVDDLKRSQANRVASQLSDVNLRRLTGQP